jgi:hypothetical protein
VATNGFRFIGIAPSVDLTEKRSKLVNDQTEAFTLDDIKGYKVYTALLTQSGENAPVATVLENTIGDIWFTYDRIGVYLINGINFFTIGKTVCPNPNGNVSIGVISGLNTYCTYANILDEGETNYLVLTTVDVDITNNNSIEKDGILNNTLIEIRVYN